MLGEGCFSRVLPCHLVETKQLETYLELMAANGKFLKDLKYAGMTAVFEEADPKKYYYCIDVYYRPLKPAELRSEEFEEYKETCGACGWEYVCAYDNLVIFKSGDEERPAELQTDLQLKREILKNVTLRAERKRMIMELGRVILCCFPVFLNRNRGLSFQELIGETVVNAPVMAVYLLIPLMLVKIVYEYFSLARLLKSDRPLPSKARLFDSFTFMFFLFFLISLYWIGEGIWFRLADTTIYSVITSCIIAALILFDGYQKKKKQVAAAWAMDGSSLFMGFGVLAALLFLIITASGLPQTGSYRFMINRGNDFSENYILGISQELRGAALYPKDIGFAGDGSFSDGGAGYGAEIRESEVGHDNISHYAEGEALVYVTDTDSYGDFTDVYRNLRYVGTMTVRLFDEKQTARFLRSKGLSLEGAQSLELLPEVDSYLLASGKEMVHLKGNLVVIHFLNSYDERSFEVTKEDVREAVAEKLQKTIELYGV